MHEAAKPLSIFGQQMIPLDAAFQKNLPLSSFAQEEHVCAKRHCVCVCVCRNLNRRAHWTHRQKRQLASGSIELLAASPRSTHATKQVARTPENNSLDVLRTLNSAGLAREFELLFKSITVVVIKRMQVRLCKIVEASSAQSTTFNRGLECYHELSKETNSVKWTRPQKRNSAAARS